MRSRRLSLLLFLLVSLIAVGGFLLVPPVKVGGSSSSLLVILIFFFRASCFRFLDRCLIVIAEERSRTYDGMDWVDAVR